MNHPDFTHLRRLVDEAITFNDIPMAKQLAGQGLNLAEHKECLAERMYFLAQLNIIDGDFSNALGYLDRAIEHNPDDGAAYNDKALCHIELGQAGDVLALFDKGISVEPDYATIHHNKGWFLHQQGQHEEALVCFKKALEIEPGRAVTYENMASIYETLGLFQEALQAYKEALRRVKVGSPAIKEQIMAEICRLEREHGKG